MYNAADLVASTSRSEGWCNAIAESLAVGTPVVATDVGGNPEQIRSPDLGILVPDGDGPALAQAVAQALDRNWNRSLIAGIGSQRTWEHAAREVEAVFERVLQSRASSRTIKEPRAFPARRDAASPIETCHAIVKDDSTERSDPRTYSTSLACACTSIPHMERPG